MSHAHDITPAPSSPRLAWCEQATAVMDSILHVRTLASREALVLGRRQRMQAVCGMVLSDGWDLVEAKPNEVIASADKLRSIGRACQGCTQALVRAPGAL